MDGRGFDALTRALGAKSGRRGAVLAALAAMWGRGPGRTREAGAQPLLSLGEVCSASEQCEQMAFCWPSTPVYCADNGYVDDGALNCCRWDGECGTHADCCGGLLCLAEYPTGECSPGRCMPRESYGVVASAGSCTETYQCKQDDGPLICSTEGRCCSVEPGYRCYMDEQCCGGMTCQGVVMAPNCMGCPGWEAGYCA